MKRVLLNYEHWEAVVEIDESPATLAMMKEQLLFWSGGQRRIDEEDGDVQAAYLKMLASTMVPLSMELNCYGIKCEFESMEGWCALDGKHGVKLISVDHWEFDSSDITIQEAS